LRDRVYASSTRALVPVDRRGSLDSDLPRWDDDCRRFARAVDDPSFGDQLPEANWGPHDIGDLELKVYVNERLNRLADLVEAARQKDRG